MIRDQQDTREAVRIAKAALRKAEAPMKAAKREKSKERRAQARERQKGLQRDPGQREPRIKNNGFLAFLRRQACLRCGYPKSDPAHIRFAPHGSGWRYVGKAEKPDDERAVPLCRSCHDLQHSMKEERFWSDELRRDPVIVANAYFESFTTGKPIPPAVGRCAPLTPPPTPRRAQ